MPKDEQNRFNAKECPGKYNNFCHIYLKKSSVSGPTKKQQSRRLMHQSG